jgi:hypothetical protein
LGAVCYQVPELRERAVKVSAGLESSRQSELAFHHARVGGNSSVGVQIEAVIGALEGAALVRGEELAQRGQALAHRGQPVAVRLQELLTVLIERLECRRSVARGHGFHRFQERVGLSPERQPLLRARRVCLLEELAVALGLAG